MQSLAGIDPACVGSLAPLLSSGLGTCLNIQGLVGSLSASSVVPGVDGWLKEMCPSTPCTDADIKQGLDVFNGTACKSAAETPGSLVGIVNIALTNYDTIRPALCSKDGDAYCVTQTLTTIQTQSGQDISFSTISGALGAMGDSNSSAFAPFANAITSGKLCTACSKTLVDGLDGLAPNGTLKAGFTQQCPNITTGVTAAGTNATNATNTTGTGSNTTSPTATGAGNGAESLGIASGSIGVVAAGVIAFSAYVL